MSSRTRMTRLVKGLLWADIENDVRHDPAILDVRDSRGRNWLHHACSVNVGKRNLKPSASIRTVDVLLDAGLDINEAAFTEGDWKATPLWFAVAFGDNVRLAKHLLERGSDPRFCLWAAVNRDNAAAIRLLLRSGSDDPTNDEGSPLLAAIDWNRPAAADALVRLGADVNFQDLHGTTPLHCALRKRRDKAYIRLLIDHGARGDLKDASGTTAVDMMMRRRDPEMRQWARDLSASS